MNSLSWLKQYDIRSEDLARLYHKSKRLQWDAAVTIDWSRTVDPSAAVLASTAFPMLVGLSTVDKLSKAQQAELTNEVALGYLAQVLHAEQGAMMMAAKLVAMAPDYEAKLYAASQTMDEARHVEVFERYLRRCGALRPLEKPLEALLQSVLTAENWIHAMIGMQLVLEGLALTNFHNYRLSAVDPLLHDILSYVIRDEARHVAFGHVYVRDAIAGLPSDDREAIADSAYESVLAIRAVTLNQWTSLGHVFARLGVDPREVLVEMRRRTQTTSDQKDAIEEFIMPSLERVGAVTERTREMYAKARVRWGTDDFIDAITANQAWTQPTHAVSPAPEIVDRGRVQAHVDREVASATRNSTRLSVIVIRCASSAIGEHARHFAGLIGDDVMFCLDASIVIIVRGLDEITVRMRADRLAESIALHPVYCGNERVPDPTIEVVSHPAIGSLFT